MIKFIEFLILGYLIYIFLRNVFGRFFITQGKQTTAGSFRQSNSYNPYQQQNSGKKSYGATKVDHIPQEENTTRQVINDDDGEYIDYKEVK